MGIKTKFAKGPNPLSMRSKSGVNRANQNPGSIVKTVKRRLRKGKRDKKLSL
jgi:hypothetical protein